MAYTKILYQLIYTPKYRKPCLIKENRPILYKYLAGTFINNKCFVHNINGIEDHIHFVFDLHPSIALADLVQKLKRAGTEIIKRENLFPEFVGWQNSYSAFTYAHEAKENLIAYVENQEVHHKNISYLEEVKGLYDEFDIDYNEKYI